MQRKKLSETERERAAQIVATFSAFVHASLTANTTAAADARSELERLGVLVSGPRCDGEAAK